MSTVPAVPQRPARSPNRAKLSHQTDDTPTIPPRPQRVSAEAQSREREAYARSPLNESPFASHTNLDDTLRPDAGHGAELTRLPSVPSMPLIGQEGIEYASLEAPQASQPAKEEAPGAHPRAPQETRNVASDLPLHAPKASASPMTQKTRVAAVTRTDSEKASVAGIGKPQTDYAELQRTPSAGQFRPPSAVSTERPSSTQAQSLYEAEEGIPSFGGTVPLYPNAGDVQAPTPAQVSAGLLSSETSRPGTTEGRRRSAMGFHGPPGSYGLHGHGVDPHDKFEKLWYQKHPEELLKEQEGSHHPAAHDERPESALTSDELNKLVHDTTHATLGMGTHAEMIGTPTEAIGYQASAEYASRSQSPQQTPPHSAKPRVSRPSSQSYAESPLKKSFSASEFKKGAVEDDDYGDKVHVIPPTRPQGKYSGAGYDPPTENLGPEGGNTDEHGGWVHERGEGVPILASDEIAKHPGSEWMQPAVSPARQLTEDEYWSAAESDHQPQYHTSHYRSRSKGHSRPSSMHSHSGLSRFQSHEEGTGTPLEEIEEYEPLFNDDDPEDVKQSKIAASKLKRPSVRQQHFPSRDIWEDTPDSLRLETTVETPEPAPTASVGHKTASAVFEHPEKEQARKAEFTEDERQAALQDTSHMHIKPKFNAGIKEEMTGRPSMRQRFPSRDIWEDTPDSLRLETTIGDQAVNVDAKPAESTQQKPTVPTRPVRAKPGTSQDAPVAPSRPLQRDIPIVPDRPKPSVPNRPARALNQEASDPATLTKTTSAGSAKESSPADGNPALAVPKQKPAVPARPAASSKLASIKAGFMSDLNSRLSKGPLPPPKPQQEEAESKDEEDKTPLADARKGRARGPARRKPAASPSPASSATQDGIGKFSITQPRTVWSIDSNKPAVISVGEGSPSQAGSTAAVTAADFGEHPTSSPLSTNTAGESLLSKADSPITKAGQLAHPASPAMDARAHRESEAAKERMRAIEAEHIGFQGDVPESTLNESAKAIPPVVKTTDDNVESSPATTATGMAGRGLGEASDAKISDIPAPANLETDSHVVPIEDPAKAELIEPEAKKEDITEA